MFNYQIAVKTADQYRAGTDSNIFVKFYGERDISPEYRLNGYISGNAFERNNLDVFTIPMDSDLGNVYKIELRSDTKYAGSDWLCDYIKVKKTSDGDGSESKFSFQSGNWIDDEKTRTLTAVSGFNVDLPERLIYKHNINGIVHFIPAGMEVSKEISTTYECSINNQTIKTFDLKSTAEIKCNYKIVEACISTELSNSIKMQTENKYGLTYTEKLNVKFPKCETAAKKYREIWTETNFEFNAILGQSKVVFNIPNERAFAGFEEID